MEKLLEKINDLPKTPGIYKFISNNKIVYIGKSKNIKSRVKSYFLGNDSRRKILRMMENIDDIDYQECNTHLEARIMEYELISDLQPIYNSQYIKDRESFYLNINRDSELFSIDKEGQIGPFLGKKFLNNFTVDFRKLFPLEIKEDEIEYNYDVFTKQLNEEEIEKTYLALNKLFSDEKEIIKLKEKLTKSMKKSSDKLEFAKAKYFKTINIYLDAIRKNIFLKNEFLGNRYIFQEREHLLFINRGEIVLKDNSGNFDEFRKKVLKLEQEDNFIETYNEELRTIVFNESMSKDVSVYHIE